MSADIRDALLIIGLVWGLTMIVAIIVTGKLSSVFTINWWILRKIFRGLK